MWFVVYTPNVQLDKLDDGFLIGQSKRVFLTAHTCIRRALDIPNIG
jgi:hypothetical protein